MGRVISLISTTADGFGDAKNVIIDAAFFELTHTLMAGAEAIAFGRNTFEQFQETWPPRYLQKNAPEWLMKMATALHHIPKIVFSSTLKTTSWNNSGTIDKIEAGYINRYKQKDKGDLLTFGSLSLFASLTKMNLVDDYYFAVQPVIAGKGESRFFTGISLHSPLPLKYVDCKQLKSGVLIIHYQNMH